MPREATRATALSQEFNALRERVNSLQTDVGQDHISALSTALAITASAKSRIAPDQLLNDLSRNRGMSWTVIAKMMNVSIPGLRKWRQGEAMSPENRHRLGVLCSFVEIVEDQFHIADVATWLEVRLWDGIPVTPADIYADNRLDLLLNLAAGHENAASVLDDFLPGWRERYLPKPFEVVEAPDGDLAIQRKS